MAEPEAGGVGPVLARWRQATREALESGVAERILLSIFREETAAARERRRRASMPDTDDPETVYTELPPGLIDLPSAVRKHGLRSSTVHDWIRQGHVMPQGRFRAPARGGGYLVVREEDLVAYLGLPVTKGEDPGRSSPSKTSGNC